MVTKIALEGVFAEGPPQDPQKVSAWNLFLDHLGAIQSILNDLGDL